MKQHDPPRRRADREEHRSEGLDEETVEGRVRAERDQDARPGQAEEQSRARIQTAALQKLAETAEPPSRERDGKPQETDQRKEHENPTRVPKAKRSQGETRAELGEKPEQSEDGQARHRKVSRPTAAVRMESVPAARGPASRAAATG